MEAFDRELRDVLLRQQKMSFTSGGEDVMPEGYLEAPLAYDAVWAVALGEWGKNTAVSLKKPSHEPNLPQIGLCKQHPIRISIFYSE